jgi:dTDP-L-rhamnose 4-epimerase
MTILVTGGAGFIGSHIVDAVADQGNEVICLDSLDPGVHRGAPGYLRDDVEYCFADLRHWQPDDRFQEVTAIVHLAALGGVSRAAREPENVITANCAGTARLIEHARFWPRLRSVVLASSFSVYGSGYTYACLDCGARRTGERNEADLAAARFEVVCAECGGQTTIEPITEGATPSPLETYAASKYMQELCFRAFSRCPVHIMRFSSVYGSRLRLDDGEATIIAKLAGWIGSGHRPKLFEDGEQIRDWVYVGDVVAAAMALLDQDTSQVVNVCSGVPTTLRAACEVIGEALGMDGAPEIVGGFRPGDMRHCLGDPSRLASLIGREPLSFAEGAGLAFAAQQGQHA